MWRSNEFVVPRVVQLSLTKLNVCLAFINFTNVRAISQSGCGMDIFRYEKGIAPVLYHFNTNRRNSIFSHDRDVVAFHLQ